MDLHNGFAAARRKSGLVERHTFFAKEISELTTWIVQSSCREVKWTDDRTVHIGSPWFKPQLLKCHALWPWASQFIPSYLLFLLFLCLTCLFNLEFVPRRVPCLLCRAGALTPLLPLAGGMAGSLCFLPDPPFPYPRAGLQGTTSCPSGDRQSCHPALAWEGLPLVIHSQGWEVEGSPHFERFLHSPDH